MPVFLVIFLFVSVSDVGGLSLRRETGTITTGTTTTGTTTTGTTTTATTTATETITTEATTGTITTEATTEATRGLDQGTIITICAGCFMIFFFALWCITEWYDEEGECPCPCFDCFLWKCLWQCLFKSSAPITAA